MPRPYRIMRPQTDVAIELGGEDAKIIYFSGGIDQRMNGICAGGTGSFIDQMASLLQTDAAGLNEYAKNYKAIYPIAARCGVFAKSDIQPLINEGATREDLAASIFQAVVNQTISGLACGKPIRGNVAFLGGPLHFLSELREAFIRTLNLKGDAIIAPDHSHLFAAVGAAMNAQEEPMALSLDQLIVRPFRRDQDGIRGKADGAPYLRMRPTTRNSLDRHEPVQGDNAETWPPIQGKCYPGHRRRLHHHQGSSGGRGRFSALPFLQQQQRKPPGHSHPRP